MKILWIVLAVAVTGVALHACAGGADGAAPGSFVPEAWSSAIPKLELTCGAKSCL